MLKSVTIPFLLLLLIGCKESEVYKKYPNTLQLQKLMHALEGNPQAFGQHILSLQEEIAALEKDPQALKETILQKKAELQNCLLIVKWRESP